MKAIICSDLHLTNRPQDSYRFDLFPWLVEQCERHNCKNILIGGDICDVKDRHEGVFINRVKDEFLDVLATGISIYANMGNHDAISPEHPTFDFLNNVGAHLFKSPEIVKIDDELVTFLPFSRDETKLFGDLSKSEINKTQLVLMHQTIKGSVASNGQKMEGLSMSVFADIKPMLLSGDIHVPQSIGKIQYVGSPYHVHFGDNFKPRCIYYNNGKLTDLHFPAPRKVTLRITDITDINDAGLNAGDKVKVVWQLNRADAHTWEKVKQNVSRSLGCLSVEISSIELDIVDKNDTFKTADKIVSQKPKDYIKAYCDNENLGEHVYNLGLEILNA